METNRGGRRAYQATDEQRALVRAMAGQTRAAIAQAVGVSIPTLRKVFAAELRADDGTSGDLFGDRPAPRRKVPVAANPGGRPPCAVTPFDREKVEAGVAMGMSVREIARAMGMSEPTVLKHFADEIETGRAKVKMQMAASAVRDGRRKGTSAVKVLAKIAQIELDALVDQGDRVAKKAGAVEAPGKKALADMAAASKIESGKWASMMQH